MKLLVNGNLVHDYHKKKTWLSMGAIFSLWPLHIAQLEILGWRLREHLFESKLKYIIDIEILIIYSFVVFLLSFLYVLTF